MRSPRADLLRNNFDFLRFGLASLVIYSHSYVLLSWTEAQQMRTEPLARATGGTLFIGSVAVFGFFIVSGFLVTASWIRAPHFWSYLKKRVLRIYPGFLVAMMLSYFIAGALGGVTWKYLLSAGSLRDWGIDLAFFQSLTIPSALAHNPIPQAVNGSVWTIQYEFLCYLMIPILALTGMARCPRLVPGLFFALLITYVLMKLRDIPSDWNQDTLTLIVGRPITLVQHATYFTAGMSAFLYRNQIAYSPIAAIIALAALVASAFDPPTLCIVMPIAFTYLILWLAFEPRIRLHHFGRPGDFSYGIYLYAFPIQQLLIQWLGPNIGPWKLTLMAWLLSIIAGMASWYAVERPMLKLKRRGAAHPFVREEEK